LYALGFSDVLNMAVDVNDRRETGAMEWNDAMPGVNGFSRRTDCENMIICAA
jgi:hypothetical protein